MILLRKTLIRQMQTMEDWTKTKISILISASQLKIQRNLLVLQVLLQILEVLRAVLEHRKRMMLI